MDLLHLFHWPRLLQLNVHQFVRMPWLSLNFLFLAFPFIRMPSSMLLLLYHTFFPLWSMCSYAITIFPGSSCIRLVFGDFSSCCCCLPCGYICLWPLYVKCRRNNSLNSLRSQSDERYVLSFRAHSIFICCENSFSLSFVNITDENEWECIKTEQRENLTRI